MTRLEQEHQTYLRNRSGHWDALADRPIGALSRHYRQRLADVYSHAVGSCERILELGCGRGDLLAKLEPELGVGVDLSNRMIDEARARYPSFQFHCADAQDCDLGDVTFDVIILSDLLNDLWDVQATLVHIRRYCHAGTRIVFNVQSHLWEYFRRLAEKRQWVTPNLPQNWLTPTDMDNLVTLSGYELVQRWQEVLCPADIPLLATLLDRFLVKLPFFRIAALTNFYVIRPLGLSPKPCMPSVSVVVPARNEAGHIGEILSRIPKMGSRTEVIFVEGNSSDNTFETIQQALADLPRDNYRLIRQPGKGKGDAVRAGFEIATGDILMILDADMTVPPEDLPRFYDILANDLGEFANGVRLVYPMQDRAMRFFNLLGNKFFSWAFSWLLGQAIRDTLCGTKVLWANDYRRIADQRSDLGEFDPFGDFDLLFGACRCHLKIMEIPIRYQARRYGETNIRRWAHGWLLLRMVVFAARLLKFK
ncbi:glycosyltransferase [Desulfatirhabdium butyrativorans]|uniref:glycosyltransferase n=1 Tax=Desulfatirhabdium butyrativorans TaxID=340467 RepID=UPI0004230D37|nr:glycosyltransferase [Desulfatirhabdium butyrativorans]